MLPKVLACLVATAIAATPLAAQHRSSAGRSRSSHPRSYSSHPRTRAIHPGTEPEHRSAAAKDQFMRKSGHAHGWPGHVVDHIVPLACGGADAPSNLQWQTTEEARAKDRVERKGCGK